MRMSFWRNHAGVDARNKRGFTLVELVIVVAVLAILAVVAVPKAADLIESAKSGTDKENLRMLNSATMMYSVNKENKNADIFEGISSESERIQRLVDANYLNKSVVAQQKNASFQWDVTGQVWKLVSDGSGSGNGGSNTPSPSASPSQTSSPSPSPSPSPLPSPQPPAWEAKDYPQPNTYVVYNGAIFYNRYYASANQIPGMQYTPWQEKTDQWRIYNVYTADDIVWYKGKQYQFKKGHGEQQGRYPDEQYGPWQLIN